VKTNVKNRIKSSVSYKIFTVVNYFLLTLAGLVCILPIVHLLAISLSGASQIALGEVSFWPRGWTIESYKIIFHTRDFFRALWISVQRVIIAVPVTLVITFLMAYPLSKSGKIFKGRSIYIALIAIPMFISAGFIPYYILIMNMGLFDTIWALVLPTALNTGNVILLMNFIRMLPKDIEESAFVDGAGFFTSMVRIVVPLCLPIIATLTLFTFVGHWNSWFDGMVFNNHVENYPLQTYLKNIIENVKPASMQSAVEAAKLSNAQINSAQIFIAMIPIIAVYPFLQKYFVKGIVVGAVKG